MAGSPKTPGVPDEVNRKRGSVGKKLGALPRIHSKMSTKPGRFKPIVPIPVLAALAVIVVIVLVTALLRPRAMVLQAVAGGGRVLYERQAAPGDEFEIRYTHSVARTLVIEKFRVTPDRQMLLYETVYQDFGAGLPSEPDEGAKMELTPFGVRITGMERVMSSIPLRVGSIARHQIALGSDVIDLISLVESGERVDIAVAAKALLPFTRR
jgi:hypothetical protein